MRTTLSRNRSGLNVERVLHRPSTDRHTSLALDCQRIGSERKIVRGLKTTQILSEDWNINMRKIIGWILSVLLALMMFLSASFKFSTSEAMVKQFEQSGFSPQLMSKIGAVEIVITLLFLVPQTSFLGAILLTGYLGGATLTHVRAGEAFFMPVMIGVMFWIALGLRNHAIFTLAMGKSPPVTK